MNVDTVNAESPACTELLSPAAHRDSSLAVCRLQVYYTSFYEKRNGDLIKSRSQSPDPLMYSTWSITVVP